MLKILIIFTLPLFIVFCESKQKPIPDPTTTTIQTVTTTTLKTEDLGVLKTKIQAIALNSQCKKTAHGEQGNPPSNYMSGIALSYARALCNQNDEYVKVASQPLGDPNKDALAYYGLKPKTSAERLQMTFSLVLGSAARESSWRWCVGKDPGAQNTTAETCEAGLYQTSYNSRSASPVLPELFFLAKETGIGCFAKEYKGTTTCSASNLKNWGTGEGVKFQELSKNCPGFATDYHAVMVRVNRKHYGPINTKKSEMKPVCVTMFQQIKDLHDSNANFCKALDRN